MKRRADHILHEMDELAEVGKQAQAADTALAHNYKESQVHSAAPAQLGCCSRHHRSRSRGQSAEGVEDMQCSRFVCHLVKNDRHPVLAGPVVLGAKRTDFLRSFVV